MKLKLLLFVCLLTSVSSVFPIKIDINLIYNDHKGNYEILKNTLDMHYGHCEIFITESFIFEFKLSKPKNNDVKLKINVICKDSNLYNFQETLIFPFKKFILSSRERTSAATNEILYTVYIGVQACDEVQENN